jgi:hypothetical protein
MKRQWAAKTAAHEIKQIKETVVVQRVFWQVFGARGPK